MKKILKNERFFFSPTGGVYEEKKISENDYAYEVLRPVFENRFWEVYALHLQYSLCYVIIGKHRNTRVVYCKNLLQTRIGYFWLPMGRDLAYIPMGDIHWTILSVQKGELIDITKQFLSVSGSMITHIDYVSPVVTFVQKMPFGKQYENKSYWKQGEEGYVSIKETEVFSVIASCKGLPEDPLFI